MPRAHDRTSGGRGGRDELVEELAKRVGGCLPRSGRVEAAPAEIAEASQGAGECPGVLGLHDERAVVSRKRVRQSTDVGDDDREAVAHRDVKRTTGGGAAVGKRDRVRFGEEGAHVVVVDIPVDERDAVPVRVYGEKVERCRPTLPCLTYHG